MDLDQIADDLYRLPPAEFTARRDERAAEARASGDRQLAAALKQLRRPAVAAWLANLVAHERPQELARFLALGPQLRQAQRQLRGEDLRSLAQQRHQAVSALSVEARRLAQQAGSKPSAAALDELRSTLEAALADEAAAAALAAGRLTVALRPEGLDSLDIGAGTTGHSRPSAAARPARSGAALTPDPGHRGRPKGPLQTQDRRRQAASAALVQAERAAEAADRALKAAADQHRRAQTATAQARAALDDRQRGETAAADRWRQAQRDAAAAGRALRQAEAARHRTDS